MQNKNNEFGVLYVVATPIGNLQDISARALETLKNVDRIISEDTRHSVRLLNHYSIKKPSLSLHEFNEKARIDDLINYLKQGETLALVSDAGTPLISDPGFLLVQQAKLHNIRVIPIPGPCAAIVALSAAGIPSDRFTFEGFLSAKRGERITQLQSLKSEMRTMIFYEAPHRLLETLDALLQTFGHERKAAIARELTKIHEEILLMDLKELHEYFTNHPDNLRGEFVIIVAGSAIKKTQEIDDNALDVLKILLNEESLSLKKAVELASKITGFNKNALYSEALKMKKT